MFFFFGKSKMSCQELADTLAPRFIKSTVERFWRQKETMGEHSWIVESARGKCRTDPFKKWALFCLAAYINGCRSSMTQDATHFELVRSFTATCGRCFIELGVFSSETEFAQLAMDRLADYLGAFQEAVAEKKMQILSRKFLLNVGCASDDLIYHMEAFGSFTTESAATKIMFDNLLKKIRLVN